MGKLLHQFPDHDADSCGILHAHTHTKHTTPSIPRPVMTNKGITHPTPAKLRINHLGLVTTWIIDKP